jgi:hypothetical protein
MPLYTYSHCEIEQDEFRSVADRNNGPPCPKCGAPMAKIIARAKAHSDLAPYYDDNLETHIESRRHRRQVMRDKGVYEKYGKGWH